MHRLNFIVIVLFSASLSAQADITLQYDRYLSYRKGSIVAAGLDLPFDKNNLGFAIGYVTLGNRILGPEFAVDGSESSRGLGMSTNYKRFLNRSTQGWFLGAQLDFQFLTNTVNNFLGPSMTNFDSRAIQPMINLGYHGILDGYILHCYIGYAVDFTNTEMNTSDTNGLWKLGFKIGKRVDPKE